MSKLCADGTVWVSFIPRCKQTRSDTIVPHVSLIASMFRYENMCVCVYKEMKSKKFLSECSDSMSSTFLNPCMLAVHRMHHNLSTSQCKDIILFASSSSLFGAFGRSADMHKWIQGERERARDRNTYLFLCFYFIYLFILQHFVVVAVFLKVLVRYLLPFGVHIHLSLAIFLLVFCCTVFSLLSKISSFEGKD